MLLLLTSTAPSSCCNGAVWLAMYKISSIISTVVDVYWHLGSSQALLLLLLLFTCDDDCTFVVVVLAVSLLLPILLLLSDVVSVIAAGVIILLLLMFQIDGPRNNYRLDHNSKNELGYNNCGDKKWFTRPIFLDFADGNRTVANEAVHSLYINCLFGKSLILGFAIAHTY